MNTKLSIIEVFAKERGSEYTILQIAKAVGKSYAHINKETRELIDEGILDKKIVGNAILCRLNSSSDMTFAYLVMLSSQKKELGKANEKDKQSDQDLLANKRVRCIFRKKSQTYVVIDNKDTFIYENKYKIINPDEIKEITDFSDIKIIHGFEFFWRCAYGR